MLISGDGPGFGDLGRAPFRPRGGTHFAQASSIYGDGEGVFGLGRQPGSMYYAPFTPGLYTEAPDVFGLGELSPQARWGLGIISIGAVFAGMVLPFLTMKNAPMPASMKKVFRTGVQWKEMKLGAMIGGSILGIAGLVGLLTALEKPCPKASSIRDEMESATPVKMPSYTPAKG